MHDIKPIFIDFEASSLSPRSYPIEFAWGSDTKDVLSFLISPANIPAWTDWNPQAEETHGISREELLQNGMDVKKAARTIVSALDGCILYSDAPKHDYFWFRELYQAAGLMLPKIEIKHVDELLYGILRPYYKDSNTIQTELDHLKYLARAQCPQQHRAAWDVDYLLCLWELCKTHLLQKSAH